MAGNSEGAKKAAQTAKDRHGDDFHSTIGKKAWDDPNRSRKVGFAAMDKEKVKQLARKGGKKTKDDYKEKETSVDTKTEEISTGAL